MLSSIKSYLKPLESFNLERDSERCFGCNPCLGSRYPSFGFNAMELGAASAFIPERFFFIFDFSQISTPIGSVRSST